LPATMIESTKPKFTHAATLLVLDLRSNNRMIEV
jgi:hypothetical protein